jgi:hypothetical protein
MGDTHTAASAEYADVLEAYNAASAGDTVQIPNDSAIWSNTLTIEKEITILGDGKTNTQLTGSGSTRLFDIALSSDVPVRISALHALYASSETGGEAIRIYAKDDNSYCCTKARIDHMKFTKGVRVINAKFWIEGLIDNNEFINSNCSVWCQGDNNYAWARDIVAGTKHALFIEDNTFTFDNSLDGVPIHIIYQYQGARTVLRHCTFDSHLYTGDMTFYDSHGNANYYVGGADARSQPISEVYNNSFRVQHGHAGAFQFRGGSALVHDNDFVCDSGGWEIPYLYEEESWATGMFSPLRTTWPAQDNIINMFFWNNHGNWINDQCDGTHIIDCLVESPNTTFIQKDRDYFMHAPEASGGYGYYTGTRKGGSQTAPTGSDPGNTEFSVTGTNAYYPYTPYTYPHPLQGEGAMDWSFSTRLRFS